MSMGGSAATGTIYHGDNAEVLERLEPELRGRVRCVYIDPPYNNQERYVHYRDVGSHEAWLDGLVPRLERLAVLLAEDGSLWVSIDDREMHYLKVAGDRIFGREQFVTTIVWQHRTTRENRKVFSNDHEYVLVWARDARRFRLARHPLPPTAEILGRYKNPDGDPRGPWQSISANVQAGHGTAAQFYELVAPSGRRHRPPPGRCWVYAEERMRREIAEGNVWFGRDGRGVPRLKRFLAEAAAAGAGLTPHTLWLADEVGTTDAAKKHLLALLPRRPVFDTPKPEGLLRRILHIVTNPGDLVLDAYLGSGTTAAVAHKMGRRWIGIERSEQAVAYAAARLEEVVGGEGGGISEAVGWRGGGAFEVVRVRPRARAARETG